MISIDGMIIGPGLALSWASTVRLSRLGGCLVGSRVDPGWELPRVRRSRGMLSELLSWINEFLPAETLAESQSAFTPT